MKRVLSLVIVFGLASCSGGGSNSSSSESISGFKYAFDAEGADIVDTSGNGNDATANSISRVDGKVGKAIRFVGDGSVINPPNGSFPDTESLTFSAWVKTDMIFTDRQQVIGGSTGGNPDIFYPIDNCGISFIDSKLSFEVSAYPGITSIESNELPIGLDDWFFVAVTYNGDKIKFYFNGVLDTEASLITNFDSSSSNQIGHNYHIYSGVHIVDQFYGYLDELSLVNEVMSDQEILDQYNSTK